MTPSMWTAIFVEMQPLEAVERIQRCGFGAVELSTEHIVMLRESGDAKALATFRKGVEDLGVQMDQAHITIFVDVANMDKEHRTRDQQTVLQDMDSMEALGIRNGVLHAGSGAPHETVEQAVEHHKIRVDALTMLAEEAGKRGVRLALENGTGASVCGDEEIWRGTATGLRELIGQIGSPNLGICVDTGHAILEGWDPAQAVRVAGDLLIATHIADNDGSGDQHRNPYSYGSTVDWVDVVQALREVGYDGPFNLEVPGERLRPDPIADQVLRHAVAICEILLNE